LLRNVAVALGNLQDLRALPALEAAVHDAEPLIRGHAAWALGRIGGGRAHHILHEALSTERDTDVRDEVISALADVAGEGEV
jgi:epoxyqueuosine reductase